MQIFNAVNRRGFLASLGAVAAAPLLTSPALALSKGQAEALIDSLSADILRAINSGKRGNALYNQFERIFAKYGDVPTIARNSLGAPWKTASSGQRSAYTKAFSGYMSRKYGKRFNEFVGAKITVTKSRAVKRGFLVESSVALQGKKPFVVEWQVSNASGRNKMFNLYIEGINMLRTEREEIGAMYDRNGRDMNKLVAYLNTVG